MDEGPDYAYLDIIQAGYDPRSTTVTSKIATVDANEASALFKGLDSVTVQKNEFKLHTVYSGTLRHIKPLQPVGQGSLAAAFKFESKFEPLQVIWQSLPLAIPEENQRV